MKETYIHIGLPRTATTFFQQFLFPNLPDISFYGVETAFYHDAFNKLQYSDDSFYDSSIFDDLLNQFGEGKVLLSNEYLSGQSIYLNNVNRSMIARRLKQLFPDGKVLLILRNQIDLLQSLYAINVQWKETRSIDDFIWSNNNKHNLDSGGASATYFNTKEGYECLDGYDYNPLVKLYKETFSDVTILLFEEFVENPKSFTQKLASFFDISEEHITQHISGKKALNTGATKIQAEKLTKLNRYYELSESSLFKKKIYNKRKSNILKNNTTGAKASFSSEKTIELKNHFKEVNALLDKNHPELGIKNYAKSYYID